MLNQHTYSSERMNRLNFNQEKHLIDYFRDNPSLWNTKDRDYNNRMLRTQKLETIARNLDLTRKDVYEKYRNLRTTFFREHKRVVHARASLAEPNYSASGQAYVSKWRHYQNMLFLTRVSGGNGNHSASLHVNEDSNSDEKPIATASNSAASHQLNNGHDIEFMGEDSLGAQRSAPAASARMSTRSHCEPMDTSPNGAQALNANGGLSLVSSSAVTSSACTPVVSHTTTPHQASSHTGGEQDLIFLNASDGTPINGSVALLNGMQNLLSTRIVPLGHATRCTHVTGTNQTTIVTLAPSSQNHHHQPPSTQSVIYSNQANKPTPNAPILQRVVKQDPSEHSPRQIPANPSAILVPLPLNLNQASLSQSSPITAPLSSLMVSGRSAQASLNEQSQAPLHSTPSPGSRKSSVFLFTSKDSPVLPGVTGAATCTLVPDSNGTHLDRQACSSTLVVNSSQVLTPVCTSVVRSPPSTVLISTNNAGITANGNENKSVLSLVSPAAKVLDYSEMREVIKLVAQEAIAEYDDEEMAFCRSLAASLRTLDRSKKDVAKLELQQVIVRHTNPSYYCHLNSYQSSSGLGNSTNLSAEVDDCASPSRDGKSSGDAASSAPVSTINTPTRKPVSNATPLATNLDNGRAAIGGDSLVSLTSNGDRANRRIDK